MAALRGGDADLPAVEVATGAERDSETKAFRLRRKADRRREQCRGDDEQSEPHEPILEENASI